MLRHICLSSNSPYEHRSVVENSSSTTSLQRRVTVIKDFVEKVSLTRINVVAFPVLSCTRKGLLVYHQLAAHQLNHSLASAIPPGVIENVASDSGLSGLKIYI